MKKGRKMNKQEKFDYAIKHTEILKAPKQSLATFGITTIHYYLVSELLDKVYKIRIREGKVIAERPKIIAPHYLIDIFEGWDDEVKDYAERLFEKYNKDIKIIGYKFKNNLERISIKSSTIDAISDKIEAEIKAQEDNLSAIIKGTDDGWQISLMKFIVELSLRSFHNNVTELKERGFFEPLNKGKKDIKAEIECLFAEAQKDRSKIYKLGEKLRLYELFEEYEDRFFALFKKNI